MNESHSTKRWSLPAKIAAYALMFAVAVASIWFIDQKVHHLPMHAGDVDPTTSAR